MRASKIGGYRHGFLVPNILGDEMIRDGGCVVNVRAEHLSKAKWWVTGIVCFATLADRLLGDRLPYPVLLFGATCAIFAWLLDWFVQRRQRSERWPERLDPKQRDAIMRAVKAVGEGVVAVRYVRGSDEARIFAEHLHGLIMDAGWLVTVDPCFWIEDRDFSGLELIVGGMFPMSPGLAALSRELSLLGFRITVTDNKSPMTVGTIVVGARLR